MSFKEVLTFFLSVLSGKRVKNFRNNNTKGNHKDTRAFLLFDVIIKVGVRKWFPLQGIMPPLLVVIYKAVFLHDGFQQGPVEPR
jgi:hypothetical protein